MKKWKIVPLLALFAACAFSFSSDLHAMPQQIGCRLFLTNTKQCMAFIDAAAVIEIQNVVPGRTELSAQGQKTSVYHVKGLVQDAVFGDLQTDQLLMFEQEYSRENEQSSHEPRLRGGGRYLLLLRKSGEGDLASYDPQWVFQVDERENLTGGTGGSYDLWKEAKTVSDMRRILPSLWLREG